MLERRRANKTKLRSLTKQSRMTSGEVAHGNENAREQPVAACVVDPGSSPAMTALWGWLLNPPPLTHAVIPDLIGDLVKVRAAIFEAVPHGLWRGHLCL